MTGRCLMLPAYWLHIEWNEESLRVVVSPSTPPPHVWLLSAGKEEGRFLSAWTFALLKEQKDWYMVAVATRPWPRWKTGEWYRAGSMLRVFPGNMVWQHCLPQDRGMLYVPGIKKGDAMCFFPFSWNVIWQYKKWRRQKGLSEYRQNRDVNGRKTIAPWCSCVYSHTCLFCALFSYINFTFCRFFLLRVLISILLS